MTQKWTTVELPEGVIELTFLSRYVFSYLNYQQMIYYTFIYTNTHTHIYIYIYTYIHTQFIYIYIYIKYMLPSVGWPSKEDAIVIHLLLLCIYILVKWHVFYICIYNTRQIISTLYGIQLSTTLLYDQGVEYVYTHLCICLNGTYFAIYKVPIIWLYIIYLYDVKQCIHFNQDTDLFSMVIKL